MRFARYLTAAALIALGCSLTAQRAAGQARNFITESVCPDDDYARFHRCALEVAGTTTLPRTADGRPDFNGYWRRRSFVFEDFEAHPETPDDNGGPSAVVDPADGKVPMQPWADEVRKENAAHYLHHNAACILAGAAGTMYMANLYQFLSAHPYRSIPLDGSPHIGSRILLWQGDPRGHWEGDTLVIDTTNQNGKFFLDQRGRFITEEARVTERLTLLDANTIHYEATFDDPNVYTQPFTIAFAFRRNAVEDAEVWEEACYESNADQMTLFRNAGLRVFPGISANQARMLKQAWESREGRP
jgi:hypothetical protein